MYAILIEFDFAKLGLIQPALGAADAFRSFDESLAKEGFNRGQGGLYFGNDSTTAVTAVLAASCLAKFPVASAVTEIRLLRIEESADLMPAMAAVCPSS